MGEIKGKFVTDIFGVAAGVLQVLTSLNGRLTWVEYPLRFSQAPN